MRKKLITFFLTSVASAAAIWSIAEAYTYFRQDLLRNTMGKYWWIVFYVLPILLALIAATFPRSTISNSEGDLHVTDKSAATIVPANDFELNIRMLFDSLKERYRNRYEQKLDGRFEITLEVSQNFHGSEPLEIKERFGKDPSAGEAIMVISKTFEERGRLLIVGNPGIGKTVLLLKLASDSLDKIDQKLKQQQENQKGARGQEYLQITEPFPVVFNLASWSERYKKFEDWLIAALVSGEGLSREFAATLLEQERIVFLLDGLDELARNEDKETAAEKRAACLKSLNKYLQRGRKAVICCRANEFVQMQVATRQDAPVSAKVVVFDLTKAQIILSLMHAQENEKNRASADNLLKILEDDNNDVFLEVLRTPFYFTTALEVFDRQILEEKDFPTDKHILKNYLTDRFIERKLDSSPNPHKFEPEGTRVSLKWLAKLMERKQLITFELADLQPVDLIRRWHYSLGIGSIFGLAVGLGFGLVPSLIAGLISNLIDGVIVGLVVGLSAGLVRGLEVSLRFGSVVGMSFGLSVGVVGGLVFGLAMGLGMGLSGALIGGLVFGVGGAFIGSLVGHEIRTEDIVRLDFTKLLNLRFWVKTLGDSMGIGMVIGLVIGLYGGPYSGLCGGVGGGLLVGLVSSLERLRNINSYAGLENPYQRIKGGFFVNLFIYSFLITLIIVLLLLIPSLELGENITKIPTIFLVGLLVIYAHLLFFTPLLKHSILRLCFYLEGSMPIKYATFLDYVTEVRILEKDGGHWRFRHQNLQEYFANQS